MADPSKCGCQSKEKMDPSSQYSITNTESNFSTITSAATLGARSQCKISQESTYSLSNTKGVCSIQYHSDGTKAAVAYRDYAIKLVDIATGDLAKEVSRHKAFGNMNVCVRFNPSHPNLLAFADTGGNIDCYDVEAEHKDVCDDPIVEANNEIQCLDFNIDGTIFATAGKDQMIRIYKFDTTNGKVKLQEETENRKLNYGSCTDTCGHAQRVHALRFLPESYNVFLSGGRDNNVKKWDARSNNPAQRLISGVHIEGDGLDIKGNHILTASYRAKNSLQLFDIRKPTVPIQSFNMSESESVKSKGGEYMECCRFYSNNIATTGGKNGSVLAFDTNTGKLVDELPFGGHVLAMDTKHNEQFICGGMSDDVKMAKVIIA